MSKNKNKNRQNTPQPNISTPKSPVNSSQSQTSNGFSLNPKLAMGLLGGLVLMSFWSAFSNDFVMWDDQMYVVENKMIQEPTFANLKRLMGVECALNYHPLTMFTLWLNAFLSGAKDATPFVVTNVFIHIVNTILVFVFTRQLTKNNVVLSFLIALIWGVHPMHVESVVWVSERKDVLYSLFFFLACIQYVKFIETDKRKYYIITFILFILSCLSKAMAVVLPLVLILIDFWYNRFSVKNIINKIPFFFIALIFGALAVHVQGGGNLGGILEKMTKDVAISEVYSLWQRICFGFYGMLVYIGKFFVPINLHNFYAYPPMDQNSAAQYVTAPLFGLIILGSAFLLRNKRREVFFGIAFFFITIMLVLQFLSVGGAILAERYSYIPYLGLSFAVFLLMDKYIKNQTTIVGIGVLVALIFMYRTYEVSKTYKDTGALFGNSYKYEQDSAVVNENLANHYGRTGSIDLVIRYGEAALQKGVKSYSLLGALGNAYHLKGDNAKALQFYADCIKNSPDYRRGVAYYNRGIVNRAAGNYADSAEDFANAMKRVDDSLQYLPYRAYSNLLAKNYSAAVRDYTWMIERKMSLDTAYNNRAVSRYSLGDANGAISDLREAIKVNPNYIEPRNNLAKLGVR